MGRVKVKLNRDGFDTLAKSPAMQSFLTQVAQSVADNAKTRSALDDAEYVVSDPEVQRKRARVAVITKNWAARYEEAKHKTLTKVANGG